MMHQQRIRIAFVSPHCLVDFTNGAATATRDGLKLLAAQSSTGSGLRFTLSDFTDYLPLGFPAG
jgi:hypothetical protein